MNIIVHVDGLCEPCNPGGIATCGVSISRNGGIIHEDARFIAEGNGASNNVGEYAGVNAALEWLLASGMQGETIELRSDSKLVINQMLGKWESRGGLYIDQYRKARDLARKFSNLRLTWIPREQNAIADALSRKAYETHCKEKGIDAACPDRKITTQSIPGTRITCMNCGWMKERGPHVGCFLNGKYKKWIPGKEASTSACEHHSPIIPG